LYSRPQTWLSFFTGAVNHFVHFHRVLVRYRHMHGRHLLKAPGRSVPLRLGLPWTVPEAAKRGRGRTGAGMAIRAHIKFSPLV
jgi:hypothetical protein